MTPHDRIRAMNRDVANIRATLAILERLIPPGIVALSNSVGDGYWQKGAGSATGHSDPVGGAIAHASDALELDSQLRLTWLLLVESPNAVANLLRQATRLAPTAAPIVALCAAGLHQQGYGSWGKRDQHGAPVACEDVAEMDRDGLCIACYRRRQRWRISERAQV